MLSFSGSHHADLKEKPIYIPLNMHCLEHATRTRMYEGQVSSIRFNCVYFLNGDDIEQIVMRGAQIALSVLPKRV